MKEPCGCRAETGSLLARKLGRCARCMRLSSAGALTGWVVAGTAFLAWPHPLAVGSSLAIAVAFTALLASHLVAYALRARRRQRGGAVTPAPLTPSSTEDPGRRDLLRTAGVAGVAALLWLLVGDTAGLSAQRARQGPVCEGKGIIEVDHNGNETAGRLTCAGVCPDETRCRPQAQGNRHGGLREWCGCKGFPEPTDCHVVKITPGRGEGGGPAYFTCAGGCPQPQDECRQVRTVIEQYRNGKPKRIAVSCECLER